MKKIIFQIVLVFSPGVALANPTACAIEVGDGETPKVIEHAVQFRGPTNGFWHYVSDDPSTWMFEIVSEKNPRVKKPTFERIAFKRPDGVYVHFEKDIKYLPNNRFTFEPAKIAKFIDESTKALKEMQKANPASFPPAAKQLLSVVITFNSGSGESDEDWLNHSCELGFGRNSLSGQLTSEDKGQSVSNFSLTIDVNNPSLESTWLKNKFVIKTDAKGAFTLKGLPLGTFIAELPTPNKVGAIAYFSAQPKNCKWEIRKDAKAQTGWTVTENNCSTLGETHR